jgi:two-component system sensor histidine kinase BaeS
MRGYLETLRMPEFHLDEATRARYLTIISDESSRLEGIIGDLLDLARLEGGGGSFVVDAVRVEDVFGRVLARHERACEQAGVKMTAVVEAGAETIRGDRERIEQALQNLAANALRHAPGGSTVALRATRRNDGIAITVTDNGEGIASEHVPHLFDRFYKVDESRAARKGPGGSGGSGLGLSIVKAIAERHGARVAVQSRPGETTFEISGLSNRSAGAGASV